MQKELRFSVDTDVYEKLSMALSLTGDDENDVFTDCIKSYISKTFEAVSQAYSANGIAKQDIDEKEYFGKAIRRIPLWSLKPNQYNHKIIKAFFELEKSVGTVTIDDMERLCNDKQTSELYVPTFKNNYAQMKIDGPKSHGKVFEDDGERVWIWSEVEGVLRKYRDAFLA